MKKVDVLRGTLIKLLEAEIANVRPAVTLGDDDSIHLSDLQQGYIRGLQLAKTHVANVHAAIMDAAPARSKQDREEMVPCPAMKCGTGHGICGLCGTAGEVTREEAEDYARMHLNRRRAEETAKDRIRW